MTQTQLGEMLGVSYQQIQKFENGKSQLSVERLKQLSEAFNVPISMLLDLNAVRDMDFRPTYLRDDEIRILNLFRRIPKSGQRSRLFKMLEDIVYLKENS